MQLKLWETVNRWHEKQRVPVAEAGGTLVFKRTKEADLATEAGRTCMELRGKPEAYEVIKTKDRWRMQAWEQLTEQM